MSSSNVVRTPPIAALVQTSSAGTSPTPLDNTASGGNNAELYPHLTSTTRINVNISTAAITHISPSPSSPLLPSALERRGSLRLPPRPSPRIPSIETPPLLPARTGNLDRPALPPRSYISATPTVEEKPMDESANVHDGSIGAAAASSIWYEYGCV